MMSAAFQVGIFLRRKYQRAKMTPKVSPPWKTPPERASAEELLGVGHVIGDVADEQDELGADERDDDGVEGGVQERLASRPRFLAWA